VENDSQIHETIDRCALRDLRREAPLGQSIGDLMRTPEWYSRYMSKVRTTTRPAQELSGKLRMIGMLADKILAPGAKEHIATPPLKEDFRLDHVTVSPDCTFESETVRLYFHHEQLVPDLWGEGSGRRFPASVILCPESAQVQQLDLYPKLLHRRGEVIDLGIFENVSAASLLVGAAIFGFVRDDGPEPQSGRH